MLEDFYKKNPNDKIWWTGEIGIKSKILFSFDKKKIYNLYPDYPFNMTNEEIEIFERENSGIVKCFAGRHELALQKMAGIEISDKQKDKGLVSVKENSEPIADYNTQVEKDIIL